MSILQKIISDFKAAFFTKASERVEPPTVPAKKQRAKHTFRPRSAFLA